ncbi:kinase domain protein [Rhizoctonia solani 123E]|uniref:Kinase domain protein n=1 Tax=Rhizoctonia solani 123E TaxID=1423351 RepID=A0A074RVS7_9AGAM|nr:kinase domain protein [Rhizoctonia solani 123E]
MERDKLAVAVAALWLADLETLGFEKRFISDGKTALDPIGSEVSVGKLDTIVKRILYKARALFGRGSATLLVADKKDPSALYVIKISCQVKTRVPESEFLEAAADIPNVIKMAHSAKWGDMLEGFGEEFLRSVQDFESREFRVLVLSPVCELLTTIKDVSVFKMCFIKLVKAHHTLFERGILHCDISIGNLMYDPKAQEPYLIDADLGKSVNKLGTPSSNHRTGTLPFMAIDLLVGAPPPHLYRHDLESFFYVLVWICAEDYHGWHRVDSVTAMAEKKLYFLIQFEIEQLRVGKFAELKSAWITKLHFLFGTGAAQKSLWIKRKSSVPFDNETLDGEVTYETFLEVINDSP